MRIESLFSGIETKTSQIFAKIRSASKEQLDHVNILEKDIHVLFKFMMLSHRRSKQHRDEIQNPSRENDFMFQRFFQASREEGRSDDPREVWLDQLLYLLITSHEVLLADAESTSDAASNATARTYKHFVESYTLQIWTAADGYEFFLNESLVDFEGDTQSFLGMEESENGPQLIWMTTDDMLHLILPISPQLALVFCDESRCWESAFADAMIRSQIPFPQNSSLANAPHKDIVTGIVPARRKGRKSWPATVDWKVSIGKLSPHHHRIIASYSLSHSISIVVVQNRARFEKARKELKVFAKEREQLWTSQGIRYGHQGEKRLAQEQAEPTPEQLNSMVDRHISALDTVLHIIRITRETPPRNKENSYRFWLDFNALLGLLSEKAKSPVMRIMPLALKEAFEAFYPPKRPGHKDLVTIDFATFFEGGMGEETFAKLTSNIEEKISELVTADVLLSQQFKTIEKEAGLALISLSPIGDNKVFEEPCLPEDDVHTKPYFKSIYGAALTFDTLIWMFEERQDILATFVRRCAVPMKDTQPNLIRVRGRR
ncbi:uncharacterized protein N7458_004012 [Penicillium daleae]|uniref:Uncharacterized protein n=1 Tax=Penicillium daleae TaxID=63821 RepID=A0AAD6CB79_9EURO|nr:uncharacterized protein N7458_004012 [Penicillium daleae]KAJ5455748.1 hypothetical protein N7458_004012 [Penicillium daleae]